MKKILLHLKSLLTLLTIATLFSLVTASAQVASQGGVPTVQDNDTTRAELASFDRFMDSHPEIAEQLRKDPPLVRNEKFVNEHAALQEYLHQHPAVRSGIRRQPSRFMRQPPTFD